jgi:cobalt/nickel transport system permease protein
MTSGFSRGRFIASSISAFLSFLKESLFSEECASRKGFMQSLDPRIKVFSCLLFILSCLAAVSIAALGALYLLCLLIALASRIDLWFFLKRTWVFIPLFSLFIALPALFSNFTPGDKLFVFGVAGAEFIITSQGVHTAALFVLRVTAMVSFSVLLSITTRHSYLLKALRVFGLPQAFVMVLGISYRYAYLFIEIVENTYLAVRSRVGAVCHYRDGQRIAGWNAASLWIRSCALNEQVYKAMLSRGYCGEVRLMDDFKSGPGDWAWVCFSGAVLLCVILFFR